jgi:hypothetical protein
VAFRAVDAAGNIDPTPAQRSFAVRTPTTPTPTTPTTPSNVFVLPAKGKANTKKGSLVLSISLPGAGGLVVRPSGNALVKPVTATVGSAGNTAVTLQPTQLGKKTLKARLRSAKGKKKVGKLNVKVTATFTPTGGVSNAQTRTYTLIRK